MARSARRPLLSTASPHSPESLSERMGRVEVSVENLHDDFARVGEAVELLSVNLNRGKETNWTLVFSAVMLVGALYAAAISPIQKDLERQAQNDLKIVQADEKLHDELDLVAERQVDVRTRLQTLEALVERLRSTTGGPK